MPLYHFHLRTPDGLERDETGLVLRDLDAAYLEACATIPGLSVDLLREGRDPMACTFVITGAPDPDRILLEVPFDERVRHIGRPTTPASPAAATALTRAQRLIVELRAEHAALGRNLRDLQALLAKPPTASPPTG
ncbi:hypothetical protein Q8W71_32515 [Methylobacterium sp. NEAU 140]|uniref:DUF6894 family protein n=1 Tax=Methylobacterium sp. NEAU 140 TaxID=3064945 RepID=UPI002732CB38|nr:hypothetical protein [Methylobacterium sp. NEAU 140]MDP4027289.1 hypothetical protein [Methylobacterium sp. NEAU 140]